MVEVGCVVEHTEGDVTSSASDIEDLLGGATGATAGVKGAYEMVFPETMDAEGHGVVHDIVVGSDGGEDAGDCGWSEEVVN